MNPINIIFTHFLTSEYQLPNTVTYFPTNHNRNYTILVTIAMSGKWIISKQTRTSKVNRTQINEQWEAVNFRWEFSELVIKIMDLRRTSGIICDHHIVRINTRPCSQQRGIKQYPNLGEINRLCVYLYYHSKSTYSVNWTSLIKQWTQLDSRKTMPIHRCDGTVTTKWGRGDLYNNRPASQSTGAKWLQITSMTISTNIQQAWKHYIL